MASICRAQVHVPDTCALCESIQDVNWYCNDCHEALCNKCKVGHQRGKKTRNDDVVPVKEANKQDEAVQPEVCNEQSGKSSDLLSCDCNNGMCTKHNQQTVNYFDKAIESQKQYMRDQVKTLKSKLGHLTAYLSNRHEASKSFKDSVDVICENVENQRFKLKEEVDFVADSVLTELSSLIEKEEKAHNEDCAPDEKNVMEIEQLITDVEQEIEKMSKTSLAELTGKPMITIPLYNVATKSVLPCLPHFVLGQTNPDQLRAMIGHLRIGDFVNEVLGCEKSEIDRQHVKQLSTFQVPQKRQVNSLCSIDDKHAWISILNSNELIKVNKEGRDTEYVNLGFRPWCLSLTTTTELLITCWDDSSLIHTLSKDRRLARFADISPLKAWGISVSDNDEVFVSTNTPTILVLNKAGKMIRQLSCGRAGQSIVCLTTGNIAVTVGDNFTGRELIVIDESNQILDTWNGDLDNGQKIPHVRQYSIARDRYDRLFVPDMNTNQVYVLPGDGRKAKCLLKKNHGIINPLAVCVDRCGHVWIGCYDGTVHVMHL